MGAGPGSRGSASLSSGTRPSEAARSPRPAPPWPPRWARRPHPCAPLPPARGSPARCASKGEPAGGVPFKSRERRATAPPPSPPESSPRRAEPGSSCARRCASHSLPGIGSPGRCLPSRRRSPDAFGASDARVTRGFETPAHLGLELLTVRAWRCGLGCPGEAGAADRREEPGVDSSAAPGMRGYSNQTPSVRGA